MGERHDSGPECRALRQQWHDLLSFQLRRPQTNKTMTIYTKKIWTNAHERRDSSSSISYAGCLGLSPVNSATIHSSNVRRSLKSQKNH